MAPQALSRAPRGQEGTTRRVRPESVLKAGIWALGVAPAMWVGWRLAGDGLGANPIEALLLISGRWALTFLLLGLAVTPLRRATGWGKIVKVRRLLGLLAFSYALSHFTVYLVLDQGLAWSFIVEDVAERPFITAGFTALLLLLPLALTSTRGWMRRLGRRWQLLHRLVYPAALLAVLHFYWKVKADTFWPLVAAGILVALLLARVARPRRRSRSRGERAASRPELATRKEGEARAPAERVTAVP